MRACLALCQERGRFLFELRPDWFPEGCLTNTELLLWERWYRHQDERRTAARAKG